jgi:zinc and cadmium transporter
VTLLWILLATVLGSVGTVAAAAVFVGLPESWRRLAMGPLLCYATGILLATALLELLPHALATAAPAGVLRGVLGGLVLFFLVEWALRSRPADRRRDGAHRGGAAPLILVSDGLHNFVDGVIIASAFLASLPLGVVAALAVVAHELPQELGDMAILVDGGFSPARALWWNAVSASVAIPGALLAYVAFEPAVQVVPYALAVAAAGFLYIGLADLVPALDRRPGVAGIRAPLLLLLGVATVLLLGEEHGPVP